MSGHGGEVFRIARNLGVPPGDLLDFSASINPLGLSGRVRNAILQTLDQIVHYPDSDCTGLKQLIADVEGVSPPQVVVGNGSTELIGLIPLALHPLSGRGVIIEPAFSEYERGLARAGYRIDRVLLSPDDRFSLPFDRIRESLKGGCDILFFANPGNPSGRYYPPEILAQLLDVAHDAARLTVIDEAFIDFIPGGESALSLLPRYPRILILRSLTKFHALPGLRLGYALGDPETITPLGELRDRWSVNTLAQAAGVAALRDREYRRETLDLIPRERGRLAEMLERVAGVTVVSGDANYLLLRLPEPADPDQLLLRLLEERILVRSCATFRGLSPRHIRVAVRSAADNQTLVEALHRHLSP